MSKQPADPLAALYAALRDDPNNDQLYNSLGCIYYRQGQISAADDAFAKAIRLNPKNWEAHYNLGNCYIKREMPEQAINHYLATLHLQPDHANAQVNLAMTYISLKRFADALPWLEQACSRAPEFAELQGHLAEAYLDLGKTTHALRQYEVATLLDPQRAAWQHNLAVLYLRNQQYAQAEQRFALALSLDPQDTTAQHMLNALQQRTTDSAPSAYVNALFDQYAGYYNKHMREQLNYQVPVLLRQAIGKILGAHSPQQRILDLGCGTGLCGVYFRDLAGYLVGVDLSQEMLSHAQASTAYDALCRYDIKQGFPGIDQHCFDLIIAADVLVYLGDLTEIFKYVHSALKPNGLFALTIETNTDDEEFKLQSSGRFAHSPPYIQNFANKYGFSIKTQEPIALRTNNAEVISGILFILQVAA